MSDGKSERMADRAPDQTPNGPPESDEWDRLVLGIKSGDNIVVQEFWNRYGPQLHRIAENHLAARLRRRIGPEDVVQSACRTFFRRLQGGQLELTDHESLWRLLCAITLTKVREQARFHGRRKRGMAQEVHELNDDNRSSTNDFQLAAHGPTPVDEAVFTDEFDKLLGLLDDEERAIVELKLQECTHEEVAERLGLSERTARRIFKRIQTKLSRTLKDR